MLKAILLLVSITTAFAINCASVSNGYYCNADKSYTWCVSGVAYNFACSSGTGCNCGTDQLCSTPCTFNCEIGSSSAQPFCQDRIGLFGTQGYFCDPNGDGFYQCVRDAFCPGQASPRSQFLSCPLGTECRCEDTTMECSSAATVSPCSYPSDRIPANDCVGHRWDCINFSNGPIEHCAPGVPCNTDNFGTGGFCFWDANTNDGVCTEDFACGGAQPCNLDADCGSGRSCVINSCCGTQGFCAPNCHA